MAAQINRTAIDRVIQKNMHAFRGKGAMTVRPGFKFTGGWITDKPSIVVTVNKKLDNLPKSRMLFAEVGNVPVDVREATGVQRMRQDEDPRTFALAAGHMRPEFQAPSFATR
jgi:hypothetical protein